MTIEDIVLEHDSRGMTDLRPHLPPNFCEEAARLVYDNPGPVLIATGFYIMSAQRPETDGPPGAIAIGRALQALGRDVAYVTDRVSLELMRGLLGKEAGVIDFPITDDASSQAIAKELLAQRQPAVLVAIERCALTRDGKHLNMRGLDISAHTARLDHLFTQHNVSVGIGDGGNEIGMGNLEEEIARVEKLPDNPASIKTSKLIITSVSNWGGYGLAAALSRLAGRNLLPSPDQESALIKKSVELGAVDGPSAQNRALVDGFSLEQNADILVQLHRLLEREGVGASTAPSQKPVE